MFCEPDTGAVDFIAFRDALRKVDYDGWATVEQDMYPAPFDKPFPIAKRTLEYLRSIGLDSRGRLTSRLDRTRLSVRRATRRCSRGQG